MKTINVLFASVFALVLAFNATAQTQDKSKTNSPKTATVTETFKVWGECGMCKTRIEKTMKAEGASNALWDEKTLMLSVTFDPAKTNKDLLSKKLASVGHDTEKFKAPDDVYAKLPECCHYEREK